MDEMKCTSSHKVVKMEIKFGMDVAGGQNRCAPLGCRLNFIGPIQERVLSDSANTKRGKL
jgi:hypothetical protein